MFCHAFLAPFLFLKPLIWLFSFRVLLFDPPSLPGSNKLVLVAQQRADFRSKCTVFQSPVGTVCTLVWHLEKLCDLQQYF